MTIIIEGVGGGTGFQLRVLVLGTEFEASLPEAVFAMPPRERYSAPYPERQERDLPRLGPARGNSVMAVGPVAVKPTATLACPIVSVLDRHLCRCGAHVGILRAVERAAVMLLDAPA